MLSPETTLAALLEDAFPAKALAPTPARMAAMRNKERAMQKL